MSEKKVTSEEWSKWSKISATKINLFAACPRKFYWRYIRKVKEKETVPMLKGSYLHKVLELFFATDKPFEGRAFLDTQLLDRMNRIADQEWATAPYTLRQDPALKEECREGLEFFVIIFLRKFMPLYNKYGMAKAWNICRPKMTEQTLETDKYLAILDVIEIDDETGEISVKDYKSGSPYGSGYSAEYTRQLAWYGYIYFQVYGKMPQYGVIDYILHGQSVRIQYTEQMFNEVKAIADQVERALASKDIKDFPLNTSFQWCKKYCFYGETVNPETGKPYCDRKT